MSDSTTFLATFPPITTAIKIAGNGDGMRIQLEIPETEMVAATQVLLWRGELLKVTIEPVKSQKEEGNGRRIISR